MLLRFFNVEHFEKLNLENPEDNALKTARNALRLLMMGWRNDWKEIISSQVLNAVFVTRDRELVKAMRVAFQEGFDHLFAQLKSPQLTEEELQQAHFYLSNCLSLLPFADITPYEYFVIPQFIDNTWTQVHYRVTPIELTPIKGVESLFIHDEDRVFAYGLEPIINKSAESHLIFMGTTYPAGQGFYTQIFTDLEAFETPGNYLFRHSYDKIEQWVDKQQQVHVCGLSLGGSLALLTALYMGEKFSRVDAFNPAGLYESWQENPLDRWDRLKQQPKVYVQKQGNDPVSAFGIWKEQWSLIHVIPPKEAQGPNQFIDHALNYAGFSNTRFEPLDTADDNKERAQRNFWLFTIARSILFYTLIAPFRYAILPFARYISNHKMLVSGTLLAVGLIGLLSSVLPVFVGATLLLCVLTPLAITLASTSYQIIKTCLGMHEAGTAKLHAANLARNESMDIYKNSMEYFFSENELENYNKAQSILGKKCIANKADDVLDGTNRVSEHSNETKRIYAPIATLVDIQTKAKIINRYSFYGSERDELINKALQEQDAIYTQGIASS